MKFHFINTPILREELEKAYMTYIAWLPSFTLEVEVEVEVEVAVKIQIQIWI